MRHAVAKLAAAFQSEHGRPPTEGETVTLVEQPWDQTRPGPSTHPGPKPTSGRLARRGDPIIGSEQAFRDMVEDCLGHRPDAQGVTDE